MNAGTFSRRRQPLGRLALRLGERAGSALAGLLPAALGPGTAEDDADPAPEPAGLTPRQLTRGLSRRTKALALARLRRLPCFHSADYLSLHPDVAAFGMDAGFHALFIGTTEGRALFHPERLARALGALTRATPKPPASRPPRPGPTPVGVFVSSVGNVFMHDIARDIAGSLGAAGVPVTLRDESAPDAPRPPLCLFVAPHEFFLLDRGRDWICEEVLANAVMLNTEQPQTRWFAAALPFVLSARGVIDLSPQQAAMFAATGLPSMHLTPSPAVAGERLSATIRRHPLFRILPRAAQAQADAATPFHDRPLDIAFFGAETPHREAWFARNASFLADYETFLHARRFGRGPIQADTADGALPALARHVCGHARILLNLHRDEFGFFEWHRIVRLGMASGAVVVSEPCPPHPDLSPGVHYFAASARQIPDLLEWLLRTPEGQESAREVQDCVANTLAGSFAPARTGARVLDFLRDSVPWRS
jgi:hypothetical protein